MGAAGSSGAQECECSAQFAVHAAERNDSGGGTWHMRARTMLRLRLLTAAAILVAAASSLAAQGRGVPPARDTSDAIGKPGALTATETAVLNAMADRNIVAHLMLEDSTEAALSEPVAGIAHNAAVREFARMLATDHAHALDLDRGVIPELRGLPRLSAADTADPRMLRTMSMRLRGLGPDSALDPTFVSAQLVHHLHLLNELGTLRAIARSAFVQQRLDDEMAVVRAHLGRAQALARRNGVPSP